LARTRRRARRFHDPGETAAPPSRLPDPQNYYKIYSCESINGQRNVRSRGWGRPLTAKPAARLQRNARATCEFPRGVLPRRWRTLWRPGSAKRHTSGTWFTSSLSYRRQSLPNSRQTPGPRVKSYLTGGEGSVDNSFDGIFSDAVKVDGAEGCHERGLQGRGTGATILGEGANRAA
jgi:hypothetical protein